jgi:hypothetical protein
MSKKGKISFALIIYFNKGLSIKSNFPLLKELEKIENIIKNKSSQIKDRENSMIKEGKNCSSRNIFLKILRILYCSFWNFFANNKFLCLILSFIVFIELKNGLASLFKNKVKITRFQG